MIKFEESTHLKGTLISMEEDEGSRFRFTIWFPYTRQGMEKIREGAMVAVPNFAQTSTEQHLSILEIISILPMHYALGDDTRGYPGFVIEAAKSASKDWEEQESEPTEDTTKIRCIAIPTNLEVKIQNSSDPILQEESNLPMVGMTASLLDTPSTEFVVNYGIRKDENAYKTGSLIRDKNVHVSVRVEDLLRTHFGIFGFTGSGKSNLLSTLVDKILTETKEPIKIVFFDLMSEYNTLLIDKLVEMPDAMLIALGDDTLPASFLEYSNNRTDDNLLRKTVKNMRDTTLMPRALEHIRYQLAVPLRSMVLNNKIRIWREGVPTIGAFIEEHRSEFTKGNMGNSRSAVTNFIDRLSQSYKTMQFSEENIEQVKKEVKDFKDNNNNNLSDTARNNLDNLVSDINLEGNKYLSMPKIPDDVKITIPEIIERLNDKTSSGLYVVQAHDPDMLRHFAAMLGNFTYESRRRSGATSPLVSFIFDEADEFIPQQAQDTYAESSAVAITLARRGRKFGLGIGIATQRVRYLNTGIMAMLHTYYVSKMPRKTDREVVAEAFGISDEMFRQTFKFKKGDWLLMSYDATGMEAIPIPIHCENANDRLIAFLKKTHEEFVANGQA